jgi:hypothetical protein
MGFRLSVFGIGHIAAGVAALGFMGYSYASTAVDHWLNFEQVNARVEKVGRLCQVHHRNEQVQAEFDTYPQYARRVWIDCADASAFAQNNKLMVAGNEYTPQVRGGPVANVRFVSPADGRAHSAPLELPPLADAEFPKVGAVIAIYAHTETPQIVEAS